MLGTAEPVNTKALVDLVQGPKAALTLARPDGFGLAQLELDAEAAERLEALLDSLQD